MIIAHLPVGYLLTCYFTKFAKREINLKNDRYFMFAGLLGSVFPDFDMFYFYLIDGRQTHHHKYFTHFPSVWMVLFIASCLLFLNKCRRNNLACYAGIFSLMGMVHLLLDTMAGDIWWLAPWVDKPFALVSVPALYQPWWFNFIFHWTFAIELGLSFWALWVWQNRLRLSS